MGKKTEGTTRYTVTLTGGGDRKIAVLKPLQEIMGIRRTGPETVTIFDKPTPIKTGITKAEAEGIKRRIEEAGGSANVTRD